MNEKTTALKAAIRSRLQASLVPADESERARALRYATAPEMFAPVLSTRFGPGYAKRLRRELAPVYQATHALLARLSHAPRLTPADLQDAVANWQRADHYLARARRLPRTYAGARARLIARDNESVAREVLEVLAARLNRAARLP